MQPGGRLRALLAGLLPALVVAVAVAADAGAQASEGSIAGRVVDESGAPLAGVCFLRRAPLPSRRAAGGTRPGADGTYKMDQVPSGSYRVAFYRCYDDSRNLLYQYYRDKPTFAAADPVTVSSGSDHHRDRAQKCTPEGSSPAGSRHRRARRSRTPA